MFYWSKCFHLGNNECQVLTIEPIRNSIHWIWSRAPTDCMRANIVCIDVNWNIFTEFDISEITNLLYYSQLELFKLHHKYAGQILLCILQLYSILSADYLSNEGAIHWSNVPDICIEYGGGDIHHRIHISASTGCIWNTATFTTTQYMCV